MGRSQACPKTREGPLRELGGSQKERRGWGGRSACHNHVVTTLMLSVTALNRFKVRNNGWCFLLRRKDKPLCGEWIGRGRTAKMNAVRKPLQCSW